MRQQLLRIVGYSALCILFTACSSLEGPDTKLNFDRSKIIAKIEINSSFVMIKKDDTLQLSFSAIAANDSIVTVNQDNVSWSSEDPLKVEVDSDGKIVGKIVSSSSIRVILRYTDDVNTVTDTVSVLVTNEKFEDATIKLVQIDSNIVGGGTLLALAGLVNPRVRVDIKKGEATVIKGLEIPLTLRSPIKVQFIINGGPDAEPVYRVDNSLVFTGPFWIKTTVNLYDDIVSDSIMFIGDYSPVSPFLFVSADANGNVIPKSLDPLDLEPQIQPCGVFIILNATNRPIDVVFSDSAEAVFNCDPLPSPLIGVNSTGENLLALPPFFGRGNRRVRTTGIVSYFVRDAVTKERLPYSGRYESITSRTGNK